MLDANGAPAFLDRPFVAGLVGALVGSLATIAGAVLVHSREREAARRAALRDAYAEWMTAIEQVQASRACRIQQRVNPGESLLALAANDLWSVTGRAQLALNKLKLLEQDRRTLELVFAAANALPEPYPPSDSWAAYEAHILASDKSSDWPPFRRSMELVEARLTERHDLW